MTAAQWRLHAACDGEDPDLFFPVGTAGPAVAQAEQAKRVCEGCPVRQPCLDWAMTVPGLEGVWGGTTEAERRGIYAADRVPAAAGR